MRAILRVASIVSVMSGPALLVALAMPSHAEPGPIGQWLMNEPLTLWDRGMMRAQEEADTAGKRIAKKAGAIGLAFASYNWDNNEIEIKFTLIGFQSDVSHENCNKMRRSFIGAFPGILIKGNEKLVTQLLTDQISGWFSHVGFQRKIRDEKLGEKLARIIFVRVNLLGKNGSITCRERIMTFDAPSQPR